MNDGNSFFKAPIFYNTFLKLNIGSFIDYGLYCYYMPDCGRELDLFSDYSFLCLSFMLSFLCFRLSCLVRFNIYLLNVLRSVYIPFLLFVSPVVRNVYFINYLGKLFQ